MLRGYVELTHSAHGTANATLHSHPLHHRCVSVERRYGCHHTGQCAPKPLCGTGVRSGGRRTLAGSQRGFLQRPGPKAGKPWANRCGPVQSKCKVVSIADCMERPGQCQAAHRGSRRGARLWPRVSRCRKAASVGSAQLVVGGGSSPVRSMAWPAPGSAAGCVCQLRNRRRSSASTSAGIGAALT